jgi:hypothetical protein
MLDAGTYRLSSLLVDFVPVLVVVPLLANASALPLPLSLFLVVPSHYALYLQISIPLHYALISKTAMNTPHLPASPKSTTTPLHDFCFLVLASYCHSEKLNVLS